MSSDLPKDVVDEIASHLDRAEDVVAFGRVCKSWNVSSTSETLWKEMYSRVWDPWHHHDQNMGSFRSKYADKEYRFKKAFNASSSLFAVWSAQSPAEGGRVSGLLMKRGSVILVSNDGDNVILSFYDAKNGQLQETKTFPCPCMSIGWSYPEFSCDKNCICVYSTPMSTLWVLSLETLEIRICNVAKAAQEDRVFRFDKLVSFDYALFRNESKSKVSYLCFNMVDSSARHADLEYTIGHSHTTYVCYRTQQGNVVPIYVFRTGSGSCKSSDDSVIKSVTIPEDGSMQPLRPSFALSNRFLALEIHKSSGSLMIADLQSAPKGPVMYKANEVLAFAGEITSIGPVWMAQTLARDANVWGFSLNRIIPQKNASGNIAVLSKRITSLASGHKHLEMDEEMNIYAWMDGNLTKHEWKLEPTQ